MLFTFPSRYWYTIGLTGVFSLAGWTRQIRAGLHVSRVTQDTAMSSHASHTGLSPSMMPLSKGFRSHSKYNGADLQPLRSVTTTQVWALPRSLATTGGIIVIFSSSGYLDVSVPPVCPPALSRSDRPSDGRVVPFGNPRIKGYLLLPAAYRSLSRPSSPP